MNHVGLHQLRFYPKEAPPLNDNGDVCEKYLAALTLRLFSIPFSEFKAAYKVTVGKRKFKTGYAFRDTHILILCNQFFKLYPLSIEINGSAFDHDCLNVEKICQIIDAEFTVSAIHAKIDTVDTPFKTLWKSLKEEAFTKDKPLSVATIEGKAKSIIFGKSPSYEIYEAGRYHEHLENKGVCRHEVKFTGRDARHFFENWLADPENLEELIKGYIKDQFGISFKITTSKDTNMSRRPELPCWRKWIAAAVPQHFDRVTPIPAVIRVQKQKLADTIYKKLSEWGTTEIQDVIERVYARHQYKKQSEPDYGKQLEFKF